jgi:hypothetical protein
MTKLIPTQAERPKIFYHLKKISSYTAWNRVLGYYKAWAEIFEKSVSEAEDAAAPNKPAQVGTEQLIFVLKGLSACEKSVVLLRQGNKAPFRYDGLECFAVANRPRKYWLDHEFQIQVGNISFNPERVPYWDEIDKAHGQLCHAWSELVAVLETGATNDPAPFALYQSARDFSFAGKPYTSPYGNKETFPPHYFPPNLPEVPDPREVVLIKNGDIVPFSGIYEPIKLEVDKRKLVSLFSKPIEPTGPFEVVGSMNYFVVNSNASHIGEGRTVEPTTWRLLWKDDRYLDGTIPAEEAGYVFNEPRPLRKAVPYSTTYTPTADEMILSVESNMPVEKAGVWAVLEDLQERRAFKVGDIFPFHKGRPVTWVWVE